MYFKIKINKNNMLLLNSFSVGKLWRFCAAVLAFLGKIQSFSLKLQS